jgi:4,5-dihydroxyphthalate decarboxylase
VTETTSLAERTALTVAVAKYPYTEQIRDGGIQLPSARLEPLDVTPIIAAFRRMIRELEFDVCEVAITTYLSAREAGIPITALPVFLNRKFHHKDIVCRGGSGITSAKDIEGHRVGIRAYSVTTGVWVRGILSDQFGVDLSKVTWVVDDEEHVQSLRLPDNVVHAPSGTSVAAMFADGGVDVALSGRAGIGRTGPPGAGWEQPPDAPPEAYQLLADADRLQAEWYADSGCYPIHGVLTVKAEVLEKDPGLARELFDAFTEAKQPFLARLDDPADTSSEIVRYRQQRRIVGNDPLPFGIEANRPSIDGIIRYAHEQGLLSRRPQAEEVFALDALCRHSHARNLFRHRELPAGAAGRQAVDLVGGAPRLGGRAAGGPRRRRGRKSRRRPGFDRLLLRQPLCGRLGRQGAGPARRSLLGGLPGRRLG